MTEELARTTIATSWHYSQNDGNSARESLDAGSVGILASFTNGDGSGEANGVLHRRFSLSNGVTQHVDIASGLENAFGDALVMYRVKVLGVINLSSNESHIVSVGGIFDTYKNNPGTSEIQVYAGGALWLYNPSEAAYPVEAGTSDNIELTASGGDFDCDLVVIGVEDTTAILTNLWNWSDGQSVYWSDGIQAFWSA